MNSTTEPAAPISVMVVDDHPLLREGIAALLSSADDFTLVAEAHGGHEAIELHRRHRPDVTLMDLQMPDMNGIDALSAIRREAPAARIVVLTTYARDVLARRALQAGAQAYVLKGDVRKDLLDTLRAVHAGQRRISAEVAIQLAEHALDSALSAREVDVLERIAAGRSNKVIAAELDITEDTVKSHVKRILAKLNARDRTQAVMIGLGRGYIGP